MKRVGNLGLMYFNLNMRRGTLSKRGLRLSDNDSQLDEAIIDKAVCDDRQYSETVPFWIDEIGDKSKPHIFKGRLNRARKQRKGL